MLLAPDHEHDEQPDEEDDADEAHQAERDRGIADLVLELTEEEVQRRYGYAWQRKSESTFQPGTDFAERLLALDVPSFRPSCAPLWRRGGCMATRRGRRRSWPATASAIRAASLGGLALEVLGE